MTEKVFFLRVKVLENLPKKLFLALIVARESNVFRHLVEDILCKVYFVLVAGTLTIIVLKVVVFDVKFQNLKHAPVEN